MLEPDCKGGIHPNARALGSLKLENEMQQLGMRLKVRGLDAVEESHLTWVEEMREQAKRVSHATGQTSADDIRKYARAIGWQPESPNAYGAVFRGKCWRCIGRKKSEHPGNHAREIRIWRWVNGY